MPVGFRLCGKLLNRSFCGWLVFKRCGADVCVGWGVCCCCLFYVGGLCSGGLCDWLRYVWLFVFCWGL